MIRGERYIEAFDAHAGGKVRNSNNVQAMSRVGVPRGWRKVWGENVSFAAFWGDGVGMGVSI
jgi:hypothetical protein